MITDNQRITGAVRGVPPCKDCTERFLACHDHCQRYKVWKAEIQRVNKAREEYARKNAKKFKYYYFKRENDG